MSIICTMLRGFFLQQCCWLRICSDMYEAYSACCWLGMCLNMLEAYTAAPNRYVLLRCCCGCILQCHIPSCCHCIHVASLFSFVFFFVCVPTNREHVTGIQKDVFSTSRWFFFMWIVFNKIVFCIGWSKIEYIIYIPMARKHAFNMVHRPHVNYNVARAVHRLRPYKSRDVY